MKYEWIKQHGALHEGRESTISESEVLDVLSGSVTSRPQPEFILDLRTRRIPQTVLDLIQPTMAEIFRVIPIAFDGETMTVATADPGDIKRADDIRSYTAKGVRMVGAPEEDVQFAIRHHYPASAADDIDVDTMIGEFLVDDDDFDLADTTAAEAVSERFVRAGRPMARRASPVPLPTNSARRTNAIQSRHPAIEDQGMFYYTVDEGQRVLMTDGQGRSQVLQGPRRVWRYGNRFERMTATVAHPGEFLIVRYRDGRQENVPGPAEIWLDRRLHDSLERQEVLQISANEAIVVYTKEEGTDKATRRVEQGPQLFVPKPGEWLHTFRWHAAKGGSQGEPKVSKGLVFQKLWLMPDQMYHDVPDVRTADDAVLTIRLMIFFELHDVVQMLDTTHDPIGDFVNAATADVVEFTGQHDFEAFKQHTHELNELKTYRHLTERADRCGYRIKNVVYRGYGAPDSLQQMHDQAIEARTRLQLERATEEQAQQLEDFKLESQLARSAKRRSEQGEEVRHELVMNHERTESELKQKEMQANMMRKQQELTSELQAATETRRNHVQQQHLQVLREMGVDMTQYLTQSRADQVIELRGEGTSPHVHVEKA